MSIFGLEPFAGTCPRCLGTFDLLIDRSMAEQRYIDDCPLCSEALTLYVVISDDDILTVRIARAERTGGGSLPSF